MKTITIKETRDNLAEIIERVSVAGESFTITKFGKAKATLSPIKLTQAPPKPNFSQFSGAWSQKEFNDFENNTKDFNQIDQNDWQ